MKVVLKFILFILLIFTIGSCDVFIRIDEVLPDNPPVKSISEFDKIDRSFIKDIISNSSESGYSLEFDVTTAKVLKEGDILFFVTNSSLLGKIRVKASPEPNGSLCFDYVIYSEDASNTARSFTDQSLINGDNFDLDQPMIPLEPFPDLNYKWNDENRYSLYAIPDNGVARIYLYKPVN